MYKCRGVIKGVAESDNCNQAEPSDDYGDIEDAVGLKKVEQKVGILLVGESDWFGFLRLHG